MEEGRRRRASARAVRYLVIAAATLVATLASAALLAADEHDEPTVAAHPDMNAPEARAALRAELERIGRRKARRAQPDAKADRQRSRTAYRDLASAEALRVARSKFERLIDSPVWRSPALRHKERIIRYLDDSTALVDTGSGSRDSVVESTIPLVGTLGSGDREPTRLDLRSQGSAYVPVNPIVETRIAKDLRAGFTVGRDAISLKPRGSADDPLVTSDKVFWANLARDSDLVLEPVPRGVQLLVHARSADSPESLTIDVDVPTGAELRAAAGSRQGGAEVVRDGKRLLFVSAPVAFDAEGEPVSSTLVVVGDAIELRFPHRDGDFAYPVMVDPVVGPNPDIMENRASSGANWTGPYRIGPAGACLDAMGGSHDPSVGLWLHFWGGNHCINGQRVEWQWRAPGTTRIDAINFWGADHQAWGTCQILGIYGDGWEGPAKWMCYSTGSDKHFHCVSNPQNPPYDGTNDCPAIGGINGNYAVNILWVLNDMNPPGGMLISSLLRDAAIWSHDWTAPYVTQFEETSNWVDEGERTIQPKAKDGGFGVKRLHLTKPLAAGGTATAPHTNRDYPTKEEQECQGSWAQPCHATWRTAPASAAEWAVSAARPLKYSTANMPEGAGNQLTLAAEDAVGNKSSGTGSISRTLRVDRSQPLEPTLTGDLNPSATALQTRKGWFREGIYTLNVTQRDSYSGVQKSEIELRPRSLATDAFARTVANGWGAADQGGAWSIVSGPTTAFATESGRGRITQGPNSPARELSLGSVALRDVEFNGLMGFKEPPEAGKTSASEWVLRRQADGKHYRVGLVMDAQRRLFLSARNQDGSAIWPDLALNTTVDFTSGTTYFRVRVQADAAAGPTTVRAKAWRDGTAEPAWQREVVDATNLGPQAAGTVGVRGGHGGTGETKSFLYDDVKVTDILRRDARDGNKSDGTPGPCSAAGCATSLTHAPFSWNTAGHAEDSHDLVVTANDPLHKAGGTTHVRTKTWQVKVDRTIPNITPSSELSSSTAWFGPDRSYRLRVGTDDPASGVQRVEFYVDGVLKDSKEPACDADRCPSTDRTTFAWTPDGTSSSRMIKVRALDLAGNWREREWPIKVDAVRPTAPVITGSLRSAENKAVNGTGSKLHVEAADGTVANPGSGVAHIKLLVGRDAATLTERSATAPDHCGGRTCTWEAGFDPLASDEGRDPRLIRVRVTDVAGNTTDTPVSYASLAARWRLNETSGQDSGDSAPRAEKLANPSFEDDTLDWVTNGSFFSGPTDPVARVSDSRAADRFVGRVSTPSAQWRGAGTDLALVAGRSYRVRVKLRRESGCNFRIGLGELALPHEDLVVDANAAPSATAYTEYTRLVRPSRSGNFRFYVATANNPCAATTFYVDDASVKEEHTGTYTGGYTLGEPGGTNDGDRAVRLNGSTGFVSVPDAAALDLGDRLSVEAWVKRNTTTGSQVIISKQTGAYGLYTVGTSLRFYKVGGSEIVTATAPLNADGRFHHVVATKDGPVAKIYLDGVDVSGPVTNQALVDNASPLLLGANTPTPALPWNGWIDDVALYSAALSGSEVAQRYSGRESDWRVAFDQTPPQQDAPAHGVPLRTGWYNGSTALGVTVSGTDGVSGIDRFSLVTEKAGGGEDVQSYDIPTCSNSLATLCPAGPAERPFTHSTSTMPEGADGDIRALVYDAAGNPSTAQAWKLKIDKTLPSIDQTNDWLGTPNAWIRPGRSYDLSVDTSDNLSGVKTIAFYINDHLVRAEPVPGCTSTGCNTDPGPVRFTWSVPADYTRADADLKVVATDEAGNPSAARTWKVRTDSVNPTIDQPTGSLARRDGTIGKRPQTLNVTARDSHSGVERIEAFVDDADDATDAPVSLGHKNGSCTATGCGTPLSDTFPWDSTNAPDRINVTVEATDQVGHETTDSWVVHLDNEAPVLTVTGGARLALATGRNIQIDRNDGIGSGIRTTQVWIDPVGDPVTSDPAYTHAEVCDPSCPTHPPREDWALPESVQPGRHEILVRVTDAAGFTAEDRWEVVLVLTGDRSKLGLEHWYQYDDTAAGGGSTVYANAETGNTVWHSVPIVNPGRGLSTAVNLTYNSHDRGGVLGAEIADAPVIDASRSVDTDEVHSLSYSEAGVGFSLGISGPTRLNEPLSGVLVAQAAEEGLELADVAAGLAGADATVPTLADVEIDLTDADGTRHTFTRSGDRWVAPPGVNMHLRRNKPGGTLATPVEDKWAMTRPDGVTHYFDTHGYLTRTEDRNGNRLEYEYEYYDALTGDVVQTIDEQTGLKASLCEGVRTGSVELFEHTVLHPAGAPPAGVPVYCGKRVKRVVSPAGADYSAAAQAAERDKRSLRVEYRPSRSLVKGVPDRPRVELPSVVGGNAGRITRITDIAGRKYEFVYDDDGYLTQFTEAAESGDQRTTQLHYEDFSSDALRAHSEDRQLDEVIEFRSDESPATKRRTVIRHADPRDRDEAGELLAPRQACGVTKRNTDERSVTPQPQSGELCRTRRSNLEKTYSYSDGPAANDREFEVDEVIHRSKSAESVVPFTSSRSRHTIDESGRPTKVTDPLGRVTQLRWNDAGNAVSQVVEAAGTDDAARIDLEYDTTHRTGVLTKKTEYPEFPDEAKKRVTTYGYDFSSGTQHSQVESLRDGDRNGRFVADLNEVAGPKAGTGQSFEIETRNDLFTGNVRKRYDRPGRQGAFAEMTYGARGELLTEDDPVPGNGQIAYTAHHDTGQPTTMLDAENKEWTYVYDALGNLEHVVDPRGSERTNVDENTAYTTTLDYDVFDRLTEERVPKLSSGEDPATGRPVPEGEMFTTRKRAFDRNGNVTSATDGEGAETKIEYTPADAPSRVLAPGRAGREERTQYVYDDADRLIARVNPKGAAVDARVTADGQVDACTGAESPPIVPHMIRYCLDAAARRTAEIATGGPAREGEGAPKPVITSFAFDDRDNQVGLVDPRRNDGRTVAQAVAAAETEGESSQRRFTYVYDKLDQRTETIEHTTDTANDERLPALRTRFTYDDNGNRTSVLPPRAFEEGSAEDPDESFETRTYFDDLDMPVAVRTPAGCTAYDRREDGKVERVTTPRGTATAPDDCSDVETDYTHHTTAFTYDTRGDVIARSIPYADDQYGRDEAEFAAWKVSYARDAVGNPAAVTDPRGNTFRNYFYDGGELRGTERPSYYDLEWDDGHAGPGGGRRYGAEADADLEVADGGPKLIEAEGRSRNAERSAEDPELPGGDGHGNFGAVEPLDPGHMLPDGGKTVFTYDDEMRLESIEDAHGEARTIEYDQAGRVLRKTWPYKDDAGIQHTYAYDANGNLESYKDGRGKQTTFLYDGFDRRIEEVAPGAQSSSTDTPDDEVTRLTYDPNGNLRSRRTPRGDAYTFGFDYDSIDRLKTETNPAGEAWSYQYDAAGNTTAERSPSWHTADEAEAPKFEKTLRYDESDRLAETNFGTTDDFEVLYDYDAEGNQTSVESPGAASTHGGDELPRRKTTEYDGRGLPWREITSTDTGADKRAQVREYDANGNLRRTVNGRGLNGDDEPAVRFTPSTSIDEATEYATVRVYDQEDQLTRVHLPWSDSGDQGGDERKLRQDFDRDSLGRVEAILSPHEEGDARVTHAAYTYLENGWIRTQTDKKLVRTNDTKANDTVAVTYNYDRTGNQTSWKTKNAHKTTAGREIVRTFYGNGTLRNRTAFTPQPASDGDCEDEGEDEAEVAADCVSVRSHSYYYNENRSLVRMEDFDPALREAGSTAPPAGTADRATDIKRDSAEREKAVDETWSRGRDTLYKYDDNGNVTKRMTDGHWDSETGDYAGADMKTTVFAYDEMDRETSMTVDGPDTQDSDDDDGPRTTTTAWWPSNEIRDRTKWNGTVETRYWDARGKIAEKRRDPKGPDAGAGAKTQDYDYDDDLNRTEDERGTHVFNARSQLVKWTRGDKYSHDDDNRDKSGTVVEYTRTDDGDIATETDNLPSGLGGRTTTTHSYSGERLKSTTTTPANGTSLRSDYHYDDFGSVTRIDHEQTGAAPAEDPPDGPPASVSCSNMPEEAEADRTYYCFDEFERNVASRGRGVNKPTDYVYDGLDRRDRKTDDKGTHEYSYVGTSELLSREAERASRVKTYDYDSDGRRLGQTVHAGEDEEEDVTHRPYATDGNGSVEGLEDGSGGFGANDGDTYLYDPYGQAENIPDAGQDGDDTDPGLSETARGNPFRFQGFYFDSGVKTYDMEARSYSPEIGRFLSQDRFESSVGDQFLQSDPLTQNRYAFAGGNPVSRVEWDGHVSSTEGTDSCGQGCENGNTRAKGRRPVVFVFRGRGGYRSSGGSRRVYTETLDSVRAKPQPKPKPTINPVGAVGPTSRPVGRPHARCALASTGSSVCGEYNKGEPADKIPEWAQPIADITGGAVCGASVGALCAENQSALYNASAFAGGVPGPGKARTALRAAKKAGPAITRRRTLRSNLERLHGPLPDGWEAHHLVAVGDKRAAAARRILERFNIDPNTAVNGIALPGRGSGRIAGRRYHPSIHTNQYYAAVERRLAGVRTRREATYVLGTIRRDIQAGTFP